jgi:AAA15 family ATPase/GTPase
VSVAPDQFLHVDRFSDDADYREWVMHHLIRPADVGIRDAKTRREDVEAFEKIALVNEHVKNGTKFALPYLKVVVSFMHGDSLDQVIDFSDESTGTKKLFHIANEWWKLANESVTLLADELGAGFHPRLLDHLIRAVNDAPGDCKSQLIFATHDTGLLEGKDGEPPALRRDQVYFTKKDANGASELYALAEFKDDARPVHNIRKRYLSGLYGAIPSVEKLSL